MGGRYYIAHVVGVVGSVWVKARRILVCAFVRWLCWWEGTLCSQAREMVVGEVGRAVRWE